MGWMFPPCRSGGCSTAPLLCRVAQGQGCAQPLASNVQSVGPQPNAAEIPEGKYLGNGLQTTIAFKSQSKPSTGKTANPGNILCTKHGQLLAGYFMTHRARSDEKVQFAPVLSCARGGCGHPWLFLWFLDRWAQWWCPKNKHWQLQRGPDWKLG